MNRCVVLFVLLGLFLLPALYSPQNISTSSDSLPYLAEPQVQEDFVISTDGDISTDSITSFSETLVDDTLFYPDSDDTLDQDVNVTDGYYYSSCEEIGSWEAGASGIWNGGITTSGGNIILNHTSTGGDTIGDYKNQQMSFVAAKDKEFKIYIKFSYSANGSVGDLRFTTGNTGADVIVLDDYSQDTWHEVNISRTEFYTVDVINFHVELVTGISLELTVSYIAIVPYTGYLETTGFSESFADVSDLVYDSNFGLASGQYSMTTDGDIATIEITANDTGNEWVIYEIRPTGISVENYIEVRFRVVGATWVFLYIEGTTGKVWPVNGLVNTDWVTVKEWIPSLGAITGDITAIGLYCNDNPNSIASGNLQTQWDYLRIDKSTEMGWQHDGSTTAGTDASSSDGDLINVTSSITFDIDTTATAALIETSYYPFLDVLINAGLGNILVEASADGSAWSTIVSSTAVTASTHYRGNVLSAGIDVKEIRVNVTNWATLDFCQLYSIANFTVTQSGVGTDDYLYVSSNILYSNVDSGTIEANHDPALSVSDTYSVYNLTTSGTAPEFSQYVSSWSTYSDDTRGATTTGTITDIKLRFDGTEIISAIKFIEDGTAPTVVRSSANPPDPENDETITLATVVTDSVEVYKVYFDAITYPASFSDVAYYATEGQDNLWVYTFSTLTTGYYVFKIIATDGANTNTLTETSYIELTVRTATVTILELELWQVNLLDYHINIDWKTTYGNTTLKVYDNDTLEATGTDEDATLQFSKSTVVGVHVLDFYIDGGSSTMWKNDTKYEIAQDQILFTSQNYDEGTDSWTYSATVNQNVNYYVYDNDTLKESGSKTAGFFSIFRDLETAVGKHIVKIKFNTSTDTAWVSLNYDITVTTTEGNAVIKAFYTSGIGIEDLEDKFKIYVDGVRSGDTFYDDTSKSYEICIKDFYGNEIYNTSHAWDNFIDITFDYHTLKIYSQIQNDPIYFVLTRGGSTISEYIGIGEILRYYLAAGTYTYTFTQGGQIYTGNLALTDDYYYTVTDLDLWDIMYKSDNAGGSNPWGLPTWYGIVATFTLTVIVQMWRLYSDRKKSKRINPRKKTPTRRG